MSQITTKYSSLTNLTANADKTDEYFYKVNITGFTASNVAEGYINVSLVYLGWHRTYSASVARAHNPVLVIKEAMRRNSLLGKLHPARLRKISTTIGMQRPTVGTTQQRGFCRMGTTQQLQNVATDTLLAEEANIAGFIYQDEDDFSDGHDKW